MRSQAHLSLTFVDDFYLQGKSKSECLQNVHGTVKLLEAHGFTVHKEKYVLEPTQTIEFLGFIIDSVKITVSLNPEKANEKAEYSATNSKAKIREIASVTVF